MIKKWKKEHQEYHLSLKEKHYQELELNKEELETTEFDNKHAGVGMD